MQFLYQSLMPFIYSCYIQGRRKGNEIIKIPQSVFCNMVSKRELGASLLAFTRSFNFVNSRLSSSDVAQPMDAADWMETFFLPDGPSCNSSAAQPAAPACDGSLRAGRTSSLGLFQCNACRSQKGGFLVGHCGLLRSREYMPVKGRYAAGEKWEGLARQMEVGEQVTPG